MNGESLNITQDNLDSSRAFSPDVFSEGKLTLKNLKPHLLMI